MPTLHLTNLNIMIGLTGRWKSPYGLVSHLYQQKPCLPEARKPASRAWTPDETPATRTKVLLPQSFDIKRKNIEAVTPAFARFSGNEARHRRRGAPEEVPKAKLT